MSDPLRRTLKLHPAARLSAVTEIAVEITRPRPGDLLLRYVVTGKISDLRLPPVAAPARTDELWQHTCFEAFLHAPPGTGYYEFNFAPSTQWAAYRFTGYRTGMSVADKIGAPRIEVKSSSTRFELHAAVELPGSAGNAAWNLALSAVIEELSGAKSYWALAHPPGKPDFHHSDCFALSLPPA